MRAFLHPGLNAVALIDAASGRAWTHAELADEVEALATRLAGAKSVVLCRSALTPGAVVAYLAALAAGHAALLIDDAAPPEVLGDIERRYGPRFVLGSDGSVDERDVADGPEPHPDLALLLSTSGTTGSAKLVRLSAAAVEANARAIAGYLELDAGERAIASLPLHYCYGLSVLHTHLLAGASVVLPPGGLLDTGFWPAVREHACTSFAGVPHSYALLRLGGQHRDATSVRTMTQAGGRMPPEPTLELADLLEARGGRLVVMYGQTEATARMAWVPPDRLRDKLGSAGIAIPGGSLEVEPDGGVVFRGPNVMHGYAHERADLARGDELGGVLRTGDVGRLDDDGFLFLTGRTARFAKLYGLRLSLDDVEAALPCAAGAVERDDRAVAVFVAGDADPQELRTVLARRFALPPRSFDVRVVDALPVTSSGKLDYAALRGAAAPPAARPAST